MPVGGIMPKSREKNVREAVAFILECYATLPCQAEFVTFDASLKLFMIKLVLWYVVCTYSSRI